jgi:hypothetical protein
LTDPEKNLYHTNDLVERHPQKPNLIKIVGRKDDQVRFPLSSLSPRADCSQIMLSSGEKTNPGPLEGFIRASPLVKSCIYFGRSRFQNGVLVEPQPGKQVDVKNGEELAAFRNAIWPYVEQANAFAPSHSRIFKGKQEVSEWRRSHVRTEMILVASSDKPLFYTTKGSVARPRTLELYQDEIEKLYDTVESSSSNALPPPKNWEKDTVQAWVLDTVTSVMRPQGGEVKPDQDLFLQGCDSLQATFIRNHLAAGLRQGQLSKIKLPADVVYKHPSVQALGIYLFEASSGSATAQDPANASKAAEDMVNKYTASFASHTGTATKPQDEAVLLTGSTGNLGCYLLAYLLQSQSAKTVYALNRPAKTALLDRQREAFEDRGLDVSLLSSSKLKLLEADLTRPDFGLPKEILGEVRLILALSLG